MAAAEASFNTDIVSMSEGFIRLKILGGVLLPAPPIKSSLPALAGSHICPSTTYKGWASPFQVPIPRTNILGASLGSPLVLTTLTPVALPCKANWGDTILVFSIALAPTVLMDPVKSLTLRSTKPTTITSFKEVISGSKTTFMLDRSPTTTSWDSNPTKLKTKTASAPGTSREKFPSMSVTVPMELPLTVTFTPDRVVPSSAEVTWPVIITKTRLSSGVVSTNGVFLELD